LQQAIEANSFYGSPQTLEKGDTENALSSVDHVLQGEQYVGGQEHFYLETQACIAIPKGEDGEMEIFVASQGTQIPQVCFSSVVGSFSVFFRILYLRTRLCELFHFIYSFQH